MATLAPGHVLLAADPDEAGAGAIVRTGRSASGRPMVWAFTDEEALAHWDRAPAPLAVIVEVTELLGADDPPTVVLNAAGPAAAILERAQDAPSPSGSGAPSPLPEPGARAELRERARSEHARGREAADPAAAAGHLFAALDACRALGDRLHAAVAARDLADVLSAAGAASDAAELRTLAAETFLDLGEGDLAAATRSDGTP